MIEQNGEFSEMMEMPEALESFRERLQQAAGPVSLHVGTRDQLQEIKDKAQLSRRVDALAERLEALEGPPKSDVIYIPSAEEIKKLQEGMR